MRWPFPRRAVPAPATPPAVRPEGAHPARRAWQTLPALVPVVNRPRLTVSAPPVAGVRPRPRRPQPAADRPVGTVAGLAEVLPALEVTRPAPEPPAPRPVRTVSTRPAAPVQLTAATAEFVGPAREPAVPHRAPGWLRALSSGPVMDPLLGAVRPSGSPPSFGAPPGAFPAAADRPPIAPVVTPRPLRAARPRGRIGLGAPLAAESQDPDAAAGVAAAGDLSRDVAAATGVGLDGVPVHRGPDAERGAVSAGADAYTTGGEVHLPAAAGHGAEARALLAHELVHVAQQRTLGADLPVEDSAEGARLEADAVAVEEAVRAGRPLPRLHHPGVVRATVATPADPAVVADTPLPVSRPAYRPDRDRPATPPEGTPRDRMPRETPPVTALRAAPRPPQPGRPQRDRPISTPNVSTRPAAFASAPGNEATPVVAGGAPAVPGGDPAVPPGRVQRRPTAMTHLRPAEPAPAAPQPAAQPAPEPAAPAASGWQQLGQSLTGEMSEMVLASWSLEQPHAVAGPGGGTGGGGTREDRFNQIAGPALERLNEQRVAAGKSELGALPPDEEARIWSQVDAGAGGPAGGPAGGQFGGQFGAGGGQPGAPGARPSGTPAAASGIHDWGGFETALGNDLGSMATDWLGTDFAQLSAGHDTATAPRAAAAPPTTAPAESGTDAHHPLVPHELDLEELDLDELTARLYDRIRSRLRLELLLDRERAGLLSDFR